MEEPAVHDESSIADSQMFEENNTNECISGVERSVSRTSSSSSHAKRKFLMPQITNNLLTNEIKNA